MEKTRVAAVLAGYSPPLTSTQIDAIAEEIAKISTVEIAEAVKKVKVAARPKRKS